MSSVATIVIPIFNEEENLPRLIRILQEINASLEHWELEILFVDDGSKDNSIANIEQFSKNEINIGYLQFTKNFGHQAALEAGISHASGEVAITMDADMEHPPEMIASMLEMFEEGYDIVQMVRKEHKGGTKEVFSRGFYWFFNKISEEKLIPGAADFRLISRKVIEVLKQIPEREKFLRALLPSLGFRQKNLFYKERVRTSGEKSYTFQASWDLAKRALLNYSHFPLLFVYYLGMILAFVSFLVGVGFIISKLIQGQKIVPGFTDIIVSIYFLSGCILGAIGILGKYLMILVQQIRGRPSHVVGKYAVSQLAETRKRKNANQS